MRQARRLNGSWRKAAAIKATVTQRSSAPAVLLEQGPPDGLRGVRREDEVDGLVLERVEDLLARLAELRDEALERLLDVGLGGRRGLVGEVPTLELDPAAVRDLHLLGEVGEVEHVREGAGDDDGVPRGQAGELSPELAEPRLVAVVLVLRRELVALLDLRTRRGTSGVSTASPERADLGRRRPREDGIDRGVRIRGGAGRAGPGGCRGSGRRGGRRTRRACRPRTPCLAPAAAAARRSTGAAPSPSPPSRSQRNPTESNSRWTAQSVPPPAEGAGVGAAAAAASGRERGFGGGGGAGMGAAGGRGDGWGGRSVRVLFVREDGGDLVVGPFGEVYCRVWLTPDFFFKKNQMHTWSTKRNLFVKSFHE